MRKRELKPTHMLVIIVAYEIYKQNKCAWLCARAGSKLLLCCAVAAEQLTARTRRPAAASQMAVSGGAGGEFARRARGPRGAFFFN